MANMAGFRAHGRFPSVVWRSKVTGAVLIRCAQPCVGLMCYRNQFDEAFLVNVSRSCRENPGSKKASGYKRLLIVDARTYRIAQLKRLLGGGSEHADYYDQAEVSFMDLPNVHAVRLSFERLTQLYTTDTDLNWYSMLEKTYWLAYVAQLLKSALDIAYALELEGRPVMVHCTDGWDRTTQLSSLSQLLADPYYRTIEGFTVLVQREWLYFGHKFADRCGQGDYSPYPDGRSPIFLQWLDCVHQVRRQFPNQFEFNEAFLVKLGLHTYSGLFGTFMCNSEQNRQQLNTPTCSVWSLLCRHLNPQIVNTFYEPGDQRLICPNYGLPSLSLWDNLYRHALFPSSKSMMGIVYLNERCTTNIEPVRSHESTTIEHDAQEAESVLGVCADFESNELNEFRSLNGLSADPAILVDDSALESRFTSPDIDSHSHRNFLGDITNTSFNADCCLLPSADGPPIELNLPSSTAFAHTSGEVMKNYPDNTSLDDTVAILPLSSVTKHASDWLISSNVRSTRFNRGLQQSNGTLSHDDSDWLSPPEVRTSPDCKRLSFSADDCNDVFFPDEEPNYNGSYRYRPSGFESGRPSESDDIFETEISNQNSFLESGVRSFSNVHALSHPSTSPVCTNSTGSLSNRSCLDVKQTKRRTPSESNSFIPINSESQRSEKCSTPAMAIWQSSADHSNCDAHSSVTHAPPSTSSFTVQSLPEGELLVSEAGLNSALSHSIGDLSAHYRVQTHDTNLLATVTNVDPSNHSLSSILCRDLALFRKNYFSTWYFTTDVNNNTSKSEAVKMLRLLDPPPSIDHSASHLDSPDHDDAVRPVSAPISPTLSGCMEPKTCSSQIPSTSQSCNSPISALSHISSAPTLQPGDLMIPSTKDAASLLPDWDGLPSLINQVTACVPKIDSSQSSERQQQTIDRLDQELRDVRLELEAQQRETEFLRQQLALLQASQAASQQFRSSHTLNVEAEKCDPLLASLQDEEAIVSKKFADKLVYATNKTVTDPVTISIVEPNGEFGKTYDDICLRSVSMCSSVQCEHPCDAEDLKHRLAHAMNDSIIRGVNDDIISSCGSFRNHIPSLPVRDQVSNMLFPAASTKDLASSYSVLPISTSSRCRSAGAPRSATSSAASDGMAQA